MRASKILFYFWFFGWGNWMSAVLAQEREVRVSHYPIDYRHKTVNQLISLMNDIKVKDAQVSLRYTTARDTRADEYGEEKFTVIESGEGEWPRILGNGILLMESNRYESFVTLLKDFQNEQAAKSLTIYQRARLQGELWDAFDEVFVTSLPREWSIESSFFEKRKEHLLVSLATSIRALAPNKMELKHLQERGDIEKVVSMKNSKEGYRRYYVGWRDNFHIHEHNLLLRRYTPVSFLIPKDSSRFLDEESYVRALADRKSSMPIGTISLIQDFILLVDQQGQIVDPHLCVLERRRDYSYYAQPALHFSMLLRTHERENVQWLEQDMQAPGWAHLDLPNIPSSRKPGFLSTIATSCVNCHGDRPIIFNPRVYKTPIEQIVVSTEWDKERVKRLIAQKQTSKEFQYLMKLFQGKKDEK